MGRREARLEKKHFFGLHSILGKRRANDGDDVILGLRMEDNAVIFIWIFVDYLLVGIWGIGGECGKRGGGGGCDWWLAGGRSGPGKNIEKGKGREEGKRNEPGKAAKGRTFGMMVLFLFHGQFEVMPQVAAVVQGCQFL